MSQVFKRILVVMFENQYRSYVMADPFMAKLAKAGLNMNNYFGCFHPSQTNYIAALAGEVCAVTNDEPPAAPLMQRTLVDLLEEGGVSWKAYMEACPKEDWNPDWQNPCYPAAKQPIQQYPDNGTDLARYFRKHNAFASFHSVQAHADRWARIVDDSQFWKDVAGDGKGLPIYSWFTPDIWNDGHYLYNTHIDTDPRTRLVPQMSTWLEHVFFGDIDTAHIQGGAAAGVAKLGLNLDVDLLLTEPAAAWAASRVPPNTLIMVTFDEADYDAKGYDTNYDGPNQIYTVLLGDMISPGGQCDTPFNHYSLIRTVEKNYGLDDLAKNDRDANWFRVLWNETFRWSPTEPVPLEVPGRFDVACMNGVPQIVFADSGGALMGSSLGSGGWSAGVALGIAASGAFRLASVGDAALLVWVTENNELEFAVCRDGQAWSKPKKIEGVKTSGDITLTGYHDVSDGKAKAMACWQTETGFIRYVVFVDGAWQPSGEVGQLTDGPMALGQLGASLFLVYKERNTQKMRITSYNLGPFNAFEAKAFDGSPAPDNNTSLHQWAGSDFLVGNFAKKLAALHNDYRASGMLALATIDGEMHLIHRGAYQDTPSAYEEVFGLTGILSSEQACSNGFGGLDQAGWTRESELAAIQLDPDSGLALTSDGDRFTLVWQEAGTRMPLWMQGGYQ